ncbi:glycosyltransferase [Candidatus Mycolicibacterium alkanivorans]|uniref:Glycosyltransferase n=1 Tax=Candidatus Mycolicibacterium alkanivorans TaxID=2954114 RepID=A0ABS9YXU3_9MYCO|nr:glycosyltransferase [Candidatus Mycolicibacterium alkanivorans]MCI4675908.1 glycosyltransferase [Candidatus Mycolicibacterium alkanivorans]
MADSRPHPLAVLIVAYRSADKLERCIESVERYLPELEVHVWDNSGPESSDVRRLASRMTNAHWYLNGENIGFAAAVNNLAAVVSGRDFLLLNPDAELVGPLSLTRAAIGERGTAAAAPMIWADEGGRGPSKVLSRTHQPWDVAHRRRTVFNALGEMAVAAERLRGTWLSNLYWSQPGDVEGYLTGACLAIRREAWDSLGPFDCEFFLYGEEADWQTRAIAAGWRVRLENESGVRHSAQGTVAGDTMASTRSSDLVHASIALQIEYRYGVRTAELYIAGIYGIDGAKRALRRGDLNRSPSDVVIIVDGPKSLSASQLVSRASALAREGHAVTVVSLRRLGALPRELPPTIRLLRRPWWWPRTWPGDGSTALVTGTTKRERAAARLFRFRRRNLRIESVEPAGHPDGLNPEVTVPNLDLESI